jgi:hypothetical protein
MSTLGQTDKSRGVSFQLAIGTASRGKAASCKLTPLANATFVGSVRSANPPFAWDFVATVRAGNFVAVPNAVRLICCDRTSGIYLESWSRLEQWALSIHVICRGSRLNGRHLVV